MLIGECPYCDKPTMTPVADSTPCYSYEACDSCGKEYVLRHSRIDSWSTRKEDFFKEHEFNKHGYIVKKDQ